MDKLNAEGDGNRIREVGPGSFSLSVFVLSENENETYD